MFLFTVIPMVRYFNTYVIDQTTKEFAAVACAMHFIFCLSFFLVSLKGDIGIPSSLWILDFFFYYPAVVYVVLELSIWIDNNYHIEKLDKVTTELLFLLSFFSARLFDRIDFFLCLFTGW